MMPWRDQLRLGWRIIRWMWWPEDWHVWARIGVLITSVTVCIGIYEQIWLAVLGSFSLGCAIAAAGRKRKARP